jgi:hypothetical protein
MGREIYGKNSMVKSLYAMFWNVEALAKCEGAQFVMVTMARLDEERVMSAACGDFLQRVRRKFRINGLRIYEFGGKTHRFHSHWVTDRFVSREDLRVCRREGGLVGIVETKEVWSGGLAGYLDKEVTKGMWRQTSLKRRWATFGEFAGRERAMDIKLISRTNYWLGCAWAIRSPSDSPARVVARGMELYRDEITGGRVWRDERRECGWAGAGEAGHGSEGGEIGEMGGDVGGDGEAGGGGALDGDGSVPF